MSKNYLIFGFSHFFGDLFDCIQSVGGILQAVVQNVPEILVPGRASLKDRLVRLPYEVDVVELENLKLGSDQFYNHVIGFSGKAMVPLLERLSKQFHGIRFTPLAHARSIIQSGARIEKGAVIDAGAIVGPWARIGAHVVLNRGSSVGHDSEVGAYSSLGPSATLCGHVRLGENVKVGANAVILPDILVGDDAVIGAGAVVTREVLPGTTVMGVPAVRRHP
jgi:sugar O-acyltransferase (sialic acid O-acetyltransferase NeuD family)